MAAPSGVHALIFGPTGAVGGAAAAEAAKRGAKVSLAMRDPKKTLPDNLAQLPRVQADLSDPDSVVRAVKETGANAAFVYVVFEHDITGIFAHLKSAGIKHVVLLSSYGIYQYADLDAALQGNFITAAHARIEVALMKSGLSYSMVRPRYFASNLLAYGPDMKKREVVMPPAKNCMDDYIVPENIGAVCGTRLFAQSSETFPLCGAQVLSQIDAVRMVAEELGITDLKIKQADLKAWRVAKEGQMPPPFLDALVDVMEKTAVEGSEPTYYKEGVANVEKYLGRKPTPLGEWIKANRSKFAAAVGV